MAEAGRTRRARRREIAFVGDFQCESDRIRRLAEPFRLALEDLQVALAAGDAAGLQRAFERLSDGAQAFHAIDTIACLAERRIARHRRA